MRRLALLAAVASMVTPASATTAGCSSERCKARVQAKRWVRLRHELTPATRAMLARLGYCESRGDYRASNGTHWGAYQYAWGPGSAGERAGFRRRPDMASPAEQDVRTARFYPGHRGEWACRA